MSAIHIPPALDRHLVSAAHTAATTGDFAAGAFEAVVDQVVRALRDQGADRREVERALSDVFAGLAYAHLRSPVGTRYVALEARALAILERAPGYR
ncbi:MAG: hypothetical protein JO180_01180 [Gemmatirosa sp.]|nr:hypothetical protein [Gemmatirosa sp.]